MYLFCHLNILENCGKSENRDEVRVLEHINIHRKGRKEEYVKETKKGQ